MQGRAGKCYEEEEKEGRLDTEKLSCCVCVEVERTYERRCEVFHAYAFCSSGALENVFHETVSLNPEAESGTVGETDDAQGGRYRRQPERKKMCNLQRRAHSDIIF